MIIPCLIWLLIWALFAVVAIYVIRLVAEAFGVGLPARMVQIVGAIIVLILVLWFFQCSGLLGMIPRMSR